MTGPEQSLRALIKQIKKADSETSQDDTLLLNQLEQTMRVLTFLETYEGSHPLLSRLAKRRQTDLNWVPASSDIRKANQAIAVIDLLHVRDSQTSDLGATSLRDPSTLPARNSLTDPAELGISAGRRKKRRTRKP